jgi:hypothetical protein
LLLSLLKIRSVIYFTDVVVFFFGIFLELLNFFIVDGDIVAKFILQHLDKVLVFVGVFSHGHGLVDGINVYEVFVIA